MKKAQESVILAYIKTKFYTFASRKSQRFVSDEKRNTKRFATKNEIR